MKNLDSLINSGQAPAITDDSRKVKQGTIFIAIKGAKFDGHLYVAEALTKGAKTAIIDKKYEQEIQKVTNNYIAVDNPREALSYLVRKTHTIPQNIVAVTGTDGKTSTTYFCKEILSALAQKAASMGTIGVISNTRAELFTQYDIITTPGTLQLYKILDELKQVGVDNVILEASSHGLHQHRLDGIPFKVAAFTSFGRDHLDYHLTMEDYLNAKLILFHSLLPVDGYAVINKDTPVSDQVIASCKTKNILTYGYNGKFIKINSIDYDNLNMRANIEIDGKNRLLECSLFGDFQVYNLLCVLSILHALGHDYNKCLEVIKTLESVPGRMQRVEQHNIFIDYAHNPDALKKVLETTKHGIRGKGRVIVVFGCGGDRDKGKRAIMGQVAQQFADIAIITDDNPRSEDPNAIRASIAEHCLKGINIAGRDQAIEYAVKQMKEGDLLLIAGKGHEKTQILADKTIEFDDYLVAKHYADKYL